MKRLLRIVEDVFNSANDACPHCGRPWIPGGFGSEYHLSGRCVEEDNPAFTINEDLFNPPDTSEVDRRQSIYVNSMYQDFPVGSKVQQQRTGVNGEIVNITPKGPSIKWDNSDTPEDWTWINWDSYHNGIQARKDI